VASGAGATDETPAAAGPAAGRGQPGNLVLLLDSLNRHLLGCYAGQNSRRRTSTDLP
jgi:hypothetical protein